MIIQEVIAKKVKWGACFYRCWMGQWLVGGCLGTWQPWESQEL